MQKRGARLAVVALLLATGGAAAVLSRHVDRQVRRLETLERRLAGRVDTMAAALVTIGLTQHGYVALGSTDLPPDTAVAALIGELTADAALLRADARSSDAARLLESFDEAIAQIAAVDGRAQEYARDGQTFLISDLLYGPAREHLAAAGERLREVRAAEATALAGERLALRQELWSTIGGTAALWTAGVLLLAWGRARPDEHLSKGSSGAEPAAEDESARERPDTAAAAIRTTLDLTAAAALCTDLSRAASTSALPDLLARAAGILDARGLIVWMGAGDQLFAAAAHGYDARIVGRLAPITRTATNATAAAWRTGRLGTVAGEPGSNGAIVAPMFNPTHCIGVLAVEVRHGREADSPTRAIAALVAAQLGSVLAAWPAASSEGAGTPSLDRAAG